MSLGVPQKGKNRKHTLCFPWLNLDDSYPSRSESVVLVGRSGRSPKTPCTEKPTQSEVFSAKIWRIEKTAQLHPEKINMEPENHPFAKETHLPNLHYCVPC